MPCPARWAQSVFLQPQDIADGSLNQFMEDNSYEEHHLPENLDGRRGYEPVDAGCRQTPRLSITWTRFSCSFRKRKGAVGTTEEEDFDFIDDETDDFDF